jgi:hypothetical protein
VPVPDSPPSTTAGGWATAAKRVTKAPTPIVGPDGNIYLVYYEGICCLATSGARLANTAWPTYNHDNAHSGWAGRPQR